MLSIQETSTNNSERSGTLRTSLIMTVLNEERSLGRLLESLNEQIRFPDEIVVVDGGSSDGTVRVLRSWAEQRHANLRLIEVPGASISAGRNLAAKMATGDIIAVADGGTTLSQEWLRDLASAIEAGAGMAAGFFEPAGAAPFELILSSVITPHVSEIDAGSFLPSSRSVAFTKDVFDRSGGYPEWLDYCEDLVFDINVLKLGIVKTFVPSAIAYWTARPNMHSYAKQYFRYARGDGRAGLFLHRHLLRYFTYTCALVMIAPLFRRTALKLLVAALFALHFAKFFKRVYRFRELLDSQYARALASVPGIVVVGDIAKMCGYPSGLRRRLRSSRNGIDL